MKWLKDPSLKKKKNLLILQKFHDNAVQSNILWLTLNRIEKVFCNQRIYSRTLARTWPIRCPRQHRITPVLYSLHWLPMSCRIRIKVPSLCLCSLSEGAPSYLSEVPYTHPLVSFAHLLTALRFFYQLQTKRLSEKGPSSSLAPQFWNCLPFDIRFIHSTPSFRQALKRHLLNSYFVSN